MQNPFSKSFSVDLAKQWYMEWFCALKNERTTRTTITTYTLHIFFLLHIILLLYSKSLNKVVLSKVVLKEKSLNQKQIYKLWKIN
jgi:hypothetical protein